LNNETKRRKYMCKTTLDSHGTICSAQAKTKSRTSKFELDSKHANSIIYFRKTKEMFVNAVVVTLFLVVGKCPHMLPLFTKKVLFRHLTRPHPTNHMPFTSSLLSTLFQIFLYEL